MVETKAALRQMELRTLQLVLMAHGSGEGIRH